MPSFAPRNEPIKKKEELELRKHVLENSIIYNLEQKVIEKKAEKYKTTRILYNKAILHVIREKDWRGIKHNYDKEKILKELDEWERKNISEIINDIKTELKLIDNISTKKEE